MECSIKGALGCGVEFAAISLLMTYDIALPLAQPKKKHCSDNITPKRLKKMYTEKQNTLQPGCDDAATGVYIRRAVVIAVAYIL